MGEVTKIRCTPIISNRSARQFFICQHFKELRPHTQFATQRARLTATFYISYGDKAYNRLGTTRDHNFFPLACSISFERFVLAS
jgi:hypothetical protein